MKISSKFVPHGSINNILALVQIMAWHRTDNQPLSDPMMTLMTHICTNVIDDITLFTMSSALLFKTLSVNRNINGESSEMCTE